MVLLTVAALGVGGSRVGEGGSGADGRLPYLLASAVLAVVVLAAISARDGRRPLRGAASLAALFLPVIVLGLLAFMAMKDLRAREVAGLLPPRTALPAASATPPPRPVVTPARRAEPDGTPVWPTVLALVLAAGAVVLLVRRRRDFEPPSFPALGRRDAAHDEPAPAALADPAAIADPREAVVAAFARMEAELRHAGHGRRRGEGPIEFTERVAAARPDLAGPVRRLARAYAPARFSEHPIDAAMRRHALVALDGVRRGLAEEAVA